MRFTIIMVIIDKCVIFRLCCWRRHPRNNCCFSFPFAGHIAIYYRDGPGARVRRCLLIPSWAPKKKKKKGRQKSRAIRYQSRRIAIMPVYCHPIKWYLPNTKTGLTRVRSFIFSSSTLPPHRLLCTFICIHISKRKRRGEKQDSESQIAPAHNGRRHYWKRASLPTYHILSLHSGEEEEAWKRRRRSLKKWQNSAPASTYTPVKSSK